MRHLPFFIGVRQVQITGVPSGAAPTARFKSDWLDELGCLYLQTERGFGRVHTQGMVLAGEAVEQGRWSLAGGAGPVQPQELSARDVPRRFGFVRSPAAERPARTGPRA